MLETCREAMLAAVRQHGYALKHASPELRADKEVVLAAIEQYPSAWKFADSELKHAIINRNRADVCAALKAKTKESAIDVLRKLEKRRPKSDVDWDVIDYAVALISRRFSTDATVQDAAADVSASLHNPLTKTGRHSVVGKRNRASYGAEFFFNARI